MAAETLTVAVASSLYPTLQKESTTFEQKYGVRIKLVSGSTGRLYNQIMHGAPFDVFVAADAQRPDLLIQHGKANKKYSLGYGYLGLMVDHQYSDNMQQLGEKNIHRIAIANPDVAPFGLLTKKLLLQKGLWQALKPKLVYAQNAMQANMMVNQGLVDAGFIPVDGNTAYLARILYIGVPLSDSPLNHIYLESLMHNHD